MKIFSVDAETDGLYGSVWAIGAVVLDGETEIERFEGQLDPAYVTDEWVTKNIVPVVELKLYEDYIELLNTFWKFWMKWRDETVCVADFGAPVEAGLFRACVGFNRQERNWLGPYPMHELGTLLLIRGLDVDINRRELANRPELVRHNPVDDALASGLCWQKLIEL